MCLGRLRCGFVTFKLMTKQRNFVLYTKLALDHILQTHVTLNNLRIHHKGLPFKTRHKTLSHIFHNHNLLVIIHFISNNIHYRNPFL